MARIERDPSGRSGEQKRGGQKRREQKLRYGSAGDKGKDVTSDLMTIAASNSYEYDMI
jgi:hypothetical protein